MNLSKFKLKIFNKSTASENPVSTSSEHINTQEPSRFHASYKHITNWAIAHRGIAVSLAVLAVFLLTGSVYALFSNSNKSSNDHSDAKNNTSKSEASNTNGTSGTATNNPSANNTVTNNSAISAGTAGQSNVQAAPTVPSPAIEQTTIGFVGCSNIRDTVQGYIAGGGKKMWVPTDTTYGGGTVVRWSDLSSTFWTQFDQLLATNPTTKTLWWGLCTYTPDKESDTANNAAALAVLAELRKKIPGVTIYVSAMHDYVTPHFCSITGSDGPSRMQTLATTLINTQNLQTGPTFGSLISRYQTPSTGATSINNQTIADGCHPNSAGDLFLGKRLINFFGA